MKALSNSRSEMSPAGSIWQDRHSSNLPDWWCDMSQSLDSAFKQFDQCANALDTRLDDIPYRNQNSALNHLGLRLDHTSRRLIRVLNLARIRLSDAMADNQYEILMEAYEVMAANELTRCNRLKEKIAMRMKKIKRDLEQNQSFRGANRIFRTSAPSYIDIRL